MSLDADYVVDRRRLKRRLTFWQIIAVLALAAAIVAVVGRASGLVGRGYVARLVVDSLIIEDPDRDQTLVALAEDDAARALIVRINSPGGSVVGGESLYLGLRKIAEKKPVVAVMGEFATSAGYMTALGADHIVARSGSLTGSIGVILQSADVTGLLERLGIKPEAIKSGPLKAQPNPLEPFTPEARAATERVVRDTFDFFVDLVAERRGMDRAKALRLADGRIFTGRQALGEGLIDALGGEETARQWLETARQVPMTVPVRDVTVTVERSLLRVLLDGAAGKWLSIERLRLDGLVSLWHPDTR